jgi:hypothetical protein
VIEVGKESIVKLISMNAQIKTLVKTAENASTISEHIFVNVLKVSWISTVQQILTSVTGNHVEVLDHVKTHMDRLHVIVTVVFRVVFVTLTLMNAKTVHARTTQHVTIYTAHTHVSVRADLLDTTVKRIKTNV